MELIPTEEPLADFDLKERIVQRSKEKIEERHNESSDIDQPSIIPVEDYLFPRLEL